MIHFDKLTAPIKQRITRLTGRLDDMRLRNFDILPGTEDAFTAARKFACLDQDLKLVYGVDASVEYMEANTLDVDFLTFVGPPGCGKTHLAVSTLRAYGETMGNPYEYWTTADLLRTLREKTVKQQDPPTEYFGVNFDNSYDGIINRLCGETYPEHYLLLDDLGVEKYSDWALEILQLIVDKRYIGELPLRTLFTTNDLKKIPPRIRSRLLSGVVVPMTAPDYRLRAGKLSTLKAIQRNDFIGTNNAN
jgi:hypothetical protein